MSRTEIIIGVVLALVLIGWYLSYSAARLDRLHARVEGTLAALDAQVVRRAEATLELSNSGMLDAASSLMLADLASESLAVSDSVDLPGFGPERERVESALTEGLSVLVDRDAVDAVEAYGEPGEEMLGRIRATGMRVQLARRFHNEAVTDVRRVRRKRAVRLFRLAGYAELPRTVEFDDEVPETLRER